MTETPLHRISWADYGRLRGQPGYPRFDFRVTQPAGVPDSYWSQVDPAKAAQAHGAVDIGNGHCGARILAPLPGRVSRRRDNASQVGPPGTRDALGVELHLGGDWTMEFWHFDAYVAAHGAVVERGDVLGILGSTGLGSVCHTHIELKFRGRKLDPEPYLFGAELPLRQEEDMRVRTPVVVERWTTRVGPAHPFTRSEDGKRGHFSTSEEVTSIAELTLEDGTDARLLDYGPNHEALIMARASLIPVAGSRSEGLPSQEAARRAGFSAGVAAAAQAAARVKPT